MAITRTQTVVGAGGTNATSTVLTFTNTPTVGALVTVQHGGVSGSAITSITGVCTTWTQAVSVTTNAPLEVWYGYATSGSSVTVNYNKSTNANTHCVEWAGTKPSSPLDKTATNSGTSATPTTPSISPSRPALVWGGLGGQPSSFVSGPTNGFTQVAGIADIRALAAFKVETDYETDINVGWTRSASYAWSGLIASFFPAVGAPPPPILRPQFYSTRRR